MDRLGARVAELRREHPNKDVESWCEDEARLGLKPEVRRVWALAGTRPTSNGRHQFESVFVYGFAPPKTGRSRFRIRPKANAACMGQALADFAGWADPDGRKVLVVIVDGSGGHTANALKVPPGVVPHRQPSCTPELQPAEHLWPLVREGLANRVFDGLPELTEALTTRCGWLTEHTDVIAGAVGFHWTVPAGRIRISQTWYQTPAEVDRAGRSKEPARGQPRIAGSWSRQWGHHRLHPAERLIVAAVDTAKRGG